MRVGQDPARVDHKRLDADESFLHPARHHGLKQLVQKVTLAEAAMPVLGKRRMIGNLSVEPQPAEPTIGQIEVDILA
jgi:hypothetical protein